MTVDVRRLDAIEPLVRDAISEKKLPGAVVLVGRGDRVLYQKAIGNRALVPGAEPMTLDTVFDLGVAHQSRGDDDQRDDARRAGAYPAERPGVLLHPRLRALRQGRHHHPSPAHARLGAPARRRPCGRVDGPRHGDRAGRRRGAHVAARRALRLQRHQLLSTRGHRPARERAAPRSVRARAHLRAARDEGHFVQSAGVAGAADRADRELHALRLAVSGSRDDHAARGRARSDRAPDGRSGGPRGPLQHGRGSGHLLPHVARRRRVSERANPVTPRGRKNDERRLARSRNEHAGPRMGYRLRVLVEPRRAAADWLLRTHGFHRHVALDRPIDGHVRGFPVEPGPPRWKR